MTIKKFLPEYGIESRVLKSVRMGQKIFLSCDKDFTLFAEFENYVRYLLPKDLYIDYLNRTSILTQRHTSKFDDYSQFIIDYTERDYGDSNTN